MELTSSNSASKITDNKKILYSFLSKLTIDSAVDFKIIRLGKILTSSQRPLKCIFSFQSIAADVMSTIRSAN